MINLLKSNRGKENDSASDKESMEITKENIPTTGYFDTFTSTPKTPQKKKIEKNTLLITHVNNFSNEIRKVINTKLLYLVNKMLSMIPKLRALHNLENPINDLSLRYFDLVKFLMAINSNEAKTYAIDNSNNILTLNQNCFLAENDCDLEKQD